MTDLVCFTDSKLDTAKRIRLSQKNAVLEDSVSGIQINFEAN